MFKLFPGLIQGKEDFSVEQFIAKSAIERFDVAIFSGLAGTDKVQIDSTFVSPGIQDMSRKLALRFVVALLLGTGPLSIVMDLGRAIPRDSASSREAITLVALIEWSANRTGQLRSN